VESERNDSKKALTHAMYATKTVRGDDNELFRHSKLCFAIFLIALFAKELKKKEMPRAEVKKLS
jgi:hypothetical protein